MPNLVASVRDRHALGAADIGAMYALFDRYYEGGSRAVFEHDLAGKSHVIELRERSPDGASIGALCGFSTLVLFTVEHAGRTVRAVFSGDTIIAREHWGEQALAHAFCRYAGRLQAEAPGLPLYWLLISKGHRTYRYLHVFAREYFPAPGRPTPPAMQALLDALCECRFGSTYDAATGLVHLDAAAVTRLRPEWTQVRESLADAPDVAYFLARNPRHAAGDELACLCELAPANLRSFALREFRLGGAAAVPSKAVT